MSRFELQIEHRYKNRLLSHHRLEAGDRHFILGSTKGADIRLLGQDVGGIHAVLRCKKEGWELLDMGSEQGTWISKEPICEQLIREEVQVRIGSHQLRLVPTHVDTQLFGKEQSSSESKSAKKFHQVIVKRKGLVEQSFLLAPTEDFIFLRGGSTQRWTPPRDGNWVRNQVGDSEIIQRLVGSDVADTSFGTQVRGLWEPQNRLPTTIALGVLFCMIIAIALIPFRPKDKMLDPKAESNQFTQMIYDAKLIKQKKAQAQKQVQMIKQSSGSQAAPAAPAESASAKPVNEKPQPKNVAQIANKIQAAGLSQLIGKISKRASKNASITIVSQGASADDSSTAAGGSLRGSTIPDAGALKGVGGSSKGSYRLAGVSTDGVAGGKGIGQGIGGLAAGGVGTAGEVGVVDEETEISGGLDKDVIAKYIRSQLGQIRYCYERQLSAQPDLYGKVLVKFTIGSTGAVVASQIGSTTLNSSMVEGCIVRRVAGWKFPEPTGGTQVMVSYPFLFKSTK